MKQVYPYWSIRGREFTDYNAALNYWNQFGGYWSAKLDAWTAFYVVKFPKDHPDFNPQPQTTT